MEGEQYLMDFLPTSLSNRLVSYDPVTVLPPKKVTQPRISFDAKVKFLPKAHLMQQNFQPYLRASKHVSAIKHIYEKYRGEEFDMSVEKQIQFLHESPKNSEFRTSRMPEKDFSPKGKDGAKGRGMNRVSRKEEKVKFPPIVNSYFHKFDMNLSDLSISTTKIKLH